MRFRDVLLIAAVLATGTPAGHPLLAQGRPRLELVVPAQASPRVEGPEVRGINVLADRDIRDLLRNGFPARLHYRVELWSTSGWFDDLEGGTEWDVVVRYDALDRSYRLARLQGDEVTTLGRFDQLRDAERALEQPFRAPLVARGSRRYYYRAVLRVETLSLSDLDEVERWLRGELRPAVRGQRNPGTAITRGVRTLFIRLLGGEKREYEVRSATFRPA